MIDMYLRVQMIFIIYYLYHWFNGNAFYPTNSLLNSAEYKYTSNISYCINIS